MEYAPNRGYYAVIFASLRTEGDNGYGSVAERMVELAGKQPGFRGVESVRSASGEGITISYWDSLEAIANWKGNAEHQQAQQMGKEAWYAQYHVRICKVEREYSF